ncbi:hypothetical protein IFR05_016827 [Cadophora sp. M221]|nr:hypothetical protein IFR05_016827 [Cadophora sp. M221]
MAYDVQLRKNVAFKIIIPGEKGEYEYQMQNEILRTFRDTSHLVTHEGSFLLPGHGSIHHRVLVLPLLSPSLSYRARQLPVATRISAAKQLHVALKGLHNVRLIHHDLNDGALLWEMPLYPAEYDTATKYQWLGRPKKVSLDDRLWKRGELVQQVTMPLDLLGTTTKRLLILSETLQPGYRVKGKLAI